MYPQRIVCLTEEPTELLYLLGEEHRIVGISGFTVRPARARQEKPRVSAFTSATVDRTEGASGGSPKLRPVVNLSGSEQRGCPAHGCVRDTPSVRNLRDSRQAAAWATPRLLLRSGPPSRW